MYRKTNQRATIFAKLEAQQSCNFADYDSPTSVMETVCSELNFYVDNYQFI